VSALPSIKCGMKPALLRSICLALSDMQRDSSPRQRLDCKGTRPPHVSQRRNSMSSTTTVSISCSIHHNHRCNMPQ
jgi:hypothetical protein